MSVAGGETFGASIRREKLARALVILLIAGLTLSLAFRLTDKPNSSDARQNLTAAYNLAYFGAISLSEDSGAPNPSNYREPLPIVLLAVHIALHPKLSSGLTANLINQGRAVVRVKQHNLIWAFFCMLGVAFATAAAVRPRSAAPAAAAAAVVLAYLFFLRRGSIIDRMMTELQAATLLVWSSYTLTRALRTGRAIWYVATGTLFGALALTKAYFFYPAVGLVLILLPFYIWRPRTHGRWHSAALIALMAVSMIAVIAPWSIRNQIYFDTFEITQRGGPVMLIRAYKDQMNDIEYRGAYYVYAPSVLKPILGKLLGFSMRDLEEGGRLQRLSRESGGFADRDLAAEKAGRPQDAISYYRKARAEWARLRMHYDQMNAENGSQLADRDLREQAIGIIASDPWRHLKTSVLFLWRGTSVYAVPIFIMVLLGLFARNAELIGIALLPAGAFLFLALTSHFIPRYADPVIPNLVVAFVALIAWALAKRALARRPLLPASIAR